MKYTYIKFWLFQDTTDVNSDITEDDETVEDFLTVEGFSVGTVEDAGNISGNDIPEEFPVNQKASQGIKQQESHGDIYNPYKRDISKCTENYTRCIHERW